MSGASRDVLNSPSESVESPSEVVRGSSTASSPFAAPEKHHQPFRNPSGSLQSLRGFIQSICENQGTYHGTAVLPSPVFPIPGTRQVELQSAKTIGEKSRVAPQVHPNLALFRFESCPELPLGFSPLHSTSSFSPSSVPSSFWEHYCFVQISYGPSWLFFFPTPGGRDLAFRSNGISVHSFVHCVR
ncbi:hypothetical protein DTO166G4_3662 [Paecilomyces variotii]|nr:hypothetical protein DTO032I3_7755 [Paecilomyces variotii]KAJ9214830.1 hypothetical protein DTO166G4_3662 [Paecilomyces variotii]KAJ9237498.1 hypothetical protein DTO166G5_3588 [Paecilomyces variotii]KAJ9256863.1 hypothetical protein DTO207G8_2466 [Paecilomyces variotii]KAJ9263746.1 hypothetical protein DTO195F2_2663 [Paecilomyces variotii]